MNPQIVASIATVLIVASVILPCVAYLILLERKIASWVQDRIGPNRAGPFGLLQPLADGLKFLIKEDYNPPGVDRTLFLLAPVLAVVPALLGWAVIPWGGYLEWNGRVLHITGAPLHIGVIYILAMGSMAVYAIVLGGYASNNKYSFLGSLRGTAQMLSYEIPLAMVVLIIVLLAGTPRADMIANLQANDIWFIFYHPLLAVIFFTCLLAEANRAPFDLPECETELVGGYHTEYSSMKFALFFLGEYMHMITGCAFFALLFLGAWDVPIWQEPLAGGFGMVLAKFLSFAFKIFLLLALMMLVRWTLPRFRFDQLMRLAWRALIPMTLLIMLASGMAMYFGRREWWVYLLINVAAALVALVVGPFMPEGPPVNRRVPLEGSRFNPPRPVTTQG